MADLSELPMWVIYGPNQPEYPGRYVVRKWRVLAGEVKMTDVCLVEATLEIARQRVPDGLVQVSRSVNDDPAIVEVWL